MKSNFNENLKKYKDGPIENVSVIECKESKDLKTLMVFISLSNGMSLYFNFWRMIKSKIQYSSFSENKDEINYYLMLVDEVKSKTIENIIYLSSTNDIEIEFTDGDKLQIFSFTSYEDWSVNFPEGVEEYSNFQNKNVF